MVFFIINPLPAELFHPSAAQPEGVHFGQAPYRHPGKQQDPGPAVCRYSVFRWNDGRESYWFFFESPQNWFPIDRQEQTPTFIIGDK